jgi:hypothetical protein
MENLRRDSISLALNPPCIKSIEETKEIEGLRRRHGLRHGDALHDAEECERCAAIALARRLLRERDALETAANTFVDTLAEKRERIVSLERELDAAHKVIGESLKQHTHYVDGVCDVCRSE